MQSERQLACYSLLEDNGNESGMIIVEGRTKKKRPLSIIADFCSV